MEFLVEFEQDIPEGTPESEVGDRESAEASAAARLAQAGHLMRLWKARRADGTNAIGLYRADSEGQLEGLLGALPMYDWMRIVVTPLEPHPNDPVGGRASGSATARSER